MRTASLYGICFAMGMSAAEALGNQDLLSTVLAFSIAGIAATLLADGP